MMRIKGKIKVENIRFFKNDWGVISASPVEMEEGSPALNYGGTFTLKGNMVDPMIGKSYYITANEITDPKYGLQYEIQSMASSVAISENSDERSKRLYLESIFTEAQVDALYEALDDPFETLKSQDYQSLVKVKGCGIKLAHKWTEKFEDNYSLSRLYVELKQYELTVVIMKKLLDYYHSPDLVIKKVKENPYLLTEVGGIGFSTADTIAMKSGMSPWDERRIGAYILYKLEEFGRNGNSYISSDVLMDALVEQFTNDIPDLAVAEAIHGSIKEKLWWSEDKQNIGLKKYFDLEQHICDDLIRIKKADPILYCENVDAVINRIETRQGWEFTDQQRAAIKQINDNNVTIVNGGAGCVDCDTEFFTGEKWKRIADYQKGDKVLQYNPDGTAELTEPIKYIKQPSDILYHFETKYGLSQTLSAEHDVAYITSKGHLRKIPCREMVKRQKNNGFCGRFITTFAYEGKGIPLTDDEIRLMIAIFADGHFSTCALKEDSSIYGTVRMNLKKQRKKERLEMLLDRLKIDYVKKNKATVEGNHEYYFKTAYISKHFDKQWYQCNYHQLKIITEEVMLWDGYYNKHNNYSTSCKEDADFIQFAFAATGRRATISTHDRMGRPYITNNKEYQRKSVEYTVNYTSRTLVEMCHDHRSNHTMTKIIEIIPKDGYEYCFTVPSGYLVLRKDNKIFITGNCGKTSIASAIVEMYPKARSAACCLSGKAAARLGEVIGTPGSTIHRLLGFSPQTGGFAYNSESKLPCDLIIIDEISMIGGNLFKCLLEAVKDGAKLVMLGDTGQLEAIGECNVAFDMIKSGIIPLTTLTKIHRQAAKSAIITESIKVRKGEQIIDRDWAGTAVRGENQDLILECYSDSHNTGSVVMDYFKKELEAVDYDILKLQIVTPMKSRGEASVWNINHFAQEYYNPDDGQDSIEVYYSGRGKEELRVGDKVINVRNNYRDCFTLDEYGDPELVPIFNGYIGIIQSIDKLNEVMVIDFLNVGNVMVPFSQASQIELAYAITVHKFQGAQTENVIVALDYSAYTLLSRELVYTAMTRAQKKCILVAQNKALRFAVDTERTSVKNTHLKDQLIEAEYPSEKFIF